jgi:hypothetical protein
MGETDPCRCESNTLEERLGAEDYVQKSLQSLQEAQKKLADTMQQLMMAQHGILTAQKELVQLLTAYPYAIHNSRPATELSTLERYPGLSLDAGRRLIQTYELLELCLLNLPNRDILLAQRVNRQFKSVIDSSSQLQKKLFFAIDPNVGMDSRTKINPMFEQKNLQNALPLFFDHKEKRLAYCHRDGRTRLYCRSITANKAWVHMSLSPEKPVCSPPDTSREITHRTRMLEKGSWKRMYLSQPGCSISWRVELAELRRRDGYMASEKITYLGYCRNAKSEEIWDALLDALAKSTVEERRLP